MKKYDCRLLAPAIVSFLIAICLALFLTGCGDKDDDEQIYEDEPDTAITKPTTAPAPSSRYPDVAGHGILWKPVADSGGKLAVLLNPSYGTPAVKVKNRNNQVIAVGDHVGFSNPDRATYRFGISGPEIARRYGTVYLVVGSRVFTVPNPAQRYE